MFIILRFDNIWSIDEIVSLQHICLNNVQNKCEIGSRLNNECKVILQIQISDDISFVTFKSYDTICYMQMKPVQLSKILVQS